MLITNRLVSVGLTLGAIVWGLLGTAFREQLCAGQVLTACLLLCSRCYWPKVGLQPDSTYRQYVRPLYRYCKHIQCRPCPDSFYRVWGWRQYTHRHYDHA
jgi:hypothetical protein